MRTALIVALVAMNSALAQAQDHVYNPRTGEYGQGDTVKFNNYTREWETAYKDDEVKFNNYTRKYEFAPKDSVVKFNNYTRKHQQTTVDSKIKYNNYTREHQYNR